MATLPSTSDPTPPTTASDRLTREDEGYHKGLKPRQLQMIAIGGAIGTGLFLGAGGRLASAGPGLFLVYGVCGFFVFLILRALGELVLHRPSSGSFVSYAREFFGEKAAFAVGWLYFLNWAMTSIVDITAIATYLHFWKGFDVVPQWALALIALVAGVVGQHDLGEVVRRDGVLVGADQGRRADDVPGRRARSSWPVATRSRARHRVGI